MLILAATTDKIQVITGAAVTVDVHASFMDATTADPPVVKGSTSGRLNTAITTATTSDIVAAPAASTLRTVAGITIRNKHASSPVDVTVQFNQNSTLIELVKVTLRAGETLEYADNLGWYVIAVVGSKAYTLAADVTSSSTTMAEITGLSFNTGLGSLVFRYYCILQSGATTTGYKFSVNHAGTVSQFNYHIRWVTNATAASDDVVAGAYTTAAGGVVSAFAARAKTTGGTGVLTDVDTATSDVMVIIEGHATVTVDGELELWWAPEAAASATLKAGSMLALDR